MTCIILLRGYNHFRNDNHNSINESRPYGGTAVCSKIPYFPGYPYCLNIYGIEVTLISHEDWTILGIYIVRLLCQAVTEVLNGISSENITIVGDLKVSWLIDTEKRPLYHILVNDKHYKQLISKHTCGESKYLGSCFRNISLIIKQSEPHFMPCTKNDKYM